jgi:hypothetical protein
MKLPSQIEGQTILLPSGSNSLFDHYRREHVVRVLGPGTIRPERRIILTTVLIAIKAERWLRFIHQKELVADGQHL